MWLFVKCEGKASEQVCDLMCDEIGGHVCLVDINDLVKWLDINK